MNNLTLDIKTRKYSFDDLLIKTLKIYFKNFLELTLPYLVIMIPLLFFTYNYMMHFADVQMKMTAAIAGDPSSVFKFLGEFMAEWLLMMLGSILLMSLYTPYLMKRVNAIVENSGETVGRTLKDALSVFPGFLVTYLLVGLMTLVSMLICCVPVLFMAVGLILASPAAALDKRYFHHAVGDSFKRLSGRYWKTFGFFALLYLICMSAVMFAVMPFYFIFLGSVFFQAFQTAKEVVDPAIAQLDMMKQMYQSPFYWIFIGGTMLLGGMMRGVLIVAQALTYINYRNVPLLTKGAESKTPERAQNG